MLNCCLKDLEHEGHATGNNSAEDTSVNEVTGSVGSLGTGGSSSAGVVTSAVGGTIEKVLAFEHNSCCKV